MLQPIQCSEVEVEPGRWCYSPGWYVGTINETGRVVYTSDDGNGRLNTKAECERAIEALASAGIVTEDNLEDSNDSFLIPLIYRDLFW